MLEVLTVYNGFDTLYKSAPFSHRGEQQMNDQEVEHRLTKLERDVEINVEIIKEQVSGIREDIKEMRSELTSRMDISAKWMLTVIFGGLAVIVTLIKWLP